MKLNHKETKMKTLIAGALTLLLTTSALATPTCPEEGTSCVRHVAVNGGFPFDQITLFGYFYDSSPETGELSFLQQYYLATGLKNLTQTLFTNLGSNGYISPVFVDKPGIDTDCILRLDTLELLCD